MPSLHYLHLDVFTDRLFGGNQLAVYLDPPPDLPTGTMQAIAREMAYSETTFVFPAEPLDAADPREPATPLPTADPAFRVRIFTPGSELPMAGHPTIGTAFALAQAGRIPPGTPRVVLVEGIGPVPVDLEWRAERLRFAWMTQPPPTFGRLFQAVSGFAKATGVPIAEMTRACPVQEVSCGVPYVIIPVASRAAVDRAAPDPGGHARAFAAAGLTGGAVYLFTLEPGPDDADAYARMFAPDIGIPEDPATGSAAGPLGAYLVHHGLADPGRTLRVLQGVRMGRPSWIHVAAVTAAPTAPLPADVRIEAMRVGGEAVLAGEGTLLLPE